MMIADMISERTAKLEAIIDSSNAAVTSKGGTAAGDLFGLADAIASIPSGGELPELTDPAAAGDVIAGKEYIGRAGAKQAGTLVVCNTIEVVETVGNPGVGVNVEIKSTADASGKTMTLPEPNLKSENIKSGVSIFGILGTLSSSLFDNETDCEIGTFELAEDDTDGYVVSLKRTDIEPYMIAFWTDDPKFTDDSGNPIRYKSGGLFIKSSFQNIYSCVGIVVVNGGIASSTGGAGDAYRVYPESRGIYIGSTSTYPLKAGIRYKWIARWLS